MVFFLLSGADHDFSAGGRPLASGARCVIRGQSLDHVPRYPEAHFASGRFTALTTVGFGDVHPVTPAARALTVAEALVGQRYIAILIASLVGMALQAKSLEDGGGGNKSFFEARRRLKPALQLNDAAAGGDRHRLGPVVGAEFVQDVLDMDLDGLLRDE